MTTSEGRRGREGKGGGGREWERGGKKGEEGRLKEERLKEERLKEERRRKAIEVEETAEVEIKITVLGIVEDDQRTRVENVTE